MEMYKLMALQNMMDDMERSSYFGLGEAPTNALSRPKQKGLKTLIVTNNVTTPTNASSYKSTDFIRDFLQGPNTNGGAPDVVFVTPAFMAGFAAWGQPLQKLDAGSTKLGVAINMFEAPFLNGVTIVEAPLLSQNIAGVYTIGGFSLTSQEARMMMKRPEFWNPRGIRGDAVEADWIAEGAIEIENEQHHAWVQGITGFGTS
jgi:hypothetical protein